jgi:uncharacterized protein YlxW (UPF0749 family)
LFPGQLAGRARLLSAGAVIGFVGVVAIGLQPSAPEARLPSSYRLAALIDRQGKENDQTRNEVVQLQDQLQTTREALSSQQAGTALQNSNIEHANTTAGLVAVNGTGFTVTLNDSTLESSPTGNVNDLVIHSQDVQAVVNAMWQGGAEAVSINGQRLISTSAVLCVGNTLLLNGTVHAPPYEISAIGASRERFMSDELVQKVRSDAQRFSLQFSMSRDQRLSLPAYSGPTATKFAQPAK